jgi:hypothetical protein
MPGGFSNKPRILKGAFVEYGLSIPPLFVVFQFNPEKLTRNRTLTFSVPAEKGAQTISLRQFHNKIDDLSQVRESQQVSVGEEVIGFDIRLDATDKLNEGDVVTESFGIAPQLSALEMMVHPKEESLLGAALGSLLGMSQGFGFTGRDNPPLVLFIWGRKRVLPVNITSMNVTETEFSTDLNPVRATVAVSLTVIEGPNPPYAYTKVMKEVMAVLNLANITDIANVVIP